MEHAVSDLKKFKDRVQGSCCCYLGSRCSLFRDDCTVTFIIFHEVSLKNNSSFFQDASTTRSSVDDTSPYDPQNEPEQLRVSPSFRPEQVGSLAHSLLCVRPVSLREPGRNRILMQKHSLTSEVTSKIPLSLEEILVSCPTASFQQDVNLYFCVLEICFQISAHVMCFVVSFLVDTHTVVSFLVASALGPGIS